MQYCLDSSPTLSTSIIANCSASRLARSAFNRGSLTIQLLFKDICISGVTPVNVIVSPSPKRYRDPFTISLPLSSTMFNSATEIHLK